MLHYNQADSLFFSKPGLCLEKENTLNACFKFPFPGQENEVDTLNQSETEQSFFSPLRLCLDDH